MAEAIEQLLRDGFVIAELSDGLVLGRAPESDVRLDEPSVSRRHAVVHGEPGRWSVEDCGSRNGTRVGADRLVYGTRHPLRDHDVLCLGTPLAVDAVKAALRRVYARTGLTDAAAHAKRTELCRLAQRSHWL